MLKEVQNKKIKFEGGIMKKIIYLLSVFLLFLLSCATEEESAEKESMTMGYYTVIREPYKCNVELPQNYHLLTLANSCTDRSVRFVLDGPEFFDISLNQKQEKELMIKAGSYNITFFAAGVGSDFRENQMFNFDSQECEKFTVSLNRAYRDYESQQPPKKVIPTE